MVSVRLYVEGGGDSKALRAECRRGFSELLRRAGLAGHMPRIVACGGRANAYDSFCTASASPNSRLPMLLVDAEGPLQGAGTWDHLQTREGWARPRSATDDQCHLMVELMEAWFLSSRETLVRYYGNGFRGNALPGNPEVEAIPKDDVINGLRQATRNTQKGRYDKGKHSFAILAELDLDRVQQAAPHAQRLVSTLRHHARALRSNG